VANTLNLYLNGAVGFIDWLDWTFASFARRLPHACDHNGNDNTHYRANERAPEVHKHDIVVERQTEFTVVQRQEVENSSHKTCNGCTDCQPFGPRWEWTWARAFEQHESGKRGWE
jgi:hypothetical protein